MKKNYLTTLFVLVSFILKAQQSIDATKIFGVTIADPWINVPQLKDALSSHCIKPTVRIVFDEWMDAKDYTYVVNEIATSSFVMGELLDSYYVPEYTISQYINRTTEYLDEFEDIVDIWEIGNEINGDWLGKTNEVVQKLEGAYAIVAGRGKKTALTLYYNKSCFYNRSEYEMFTWINNNISEELRLGLDYVLVSYYEDDCEDVILTQGEWQSVFDSLHVIFPNSKLGIGECGTTEDSKKAEYMDRYYNMEISTPNYIGGYFWWYYKSDAGADCVPKTNELWGTLNNISCNWATVTSTNKALTIPNRIKTYPNPVNEVVTLDFSEYPGVTSATLRTIHGQFCQSQKHDGSNEMSFTIDGPAGLYLLEIITSEGFPQTLRILKQF